MVESSNSASAESSAANGQCYDVAIIGAGFAGLGMAHRLRQAGINNFVVLERGGDVGGTWRDNTYPGCACDIPSHLYSYSFRPNADWTRLYPAQAEIWRYLKDCEEAFSLAEKCRFDVDVTRATFDDAGHLWAVELDNGTVIRTRALVSAIGGLSRPSIPQIDGMDHYRGAVFHTAQWDHTCDLSGKRVVVIGTGASAIQLVPRIAPVVGSLTVFQRTPPWVMPKGDRPMRSWERWVFRHVPMTRRLFRAVLYWRQELLGAGFTLAPRLMAYGRYVARRHVRDSINDPGLRARVTPDYEMGCKRVLLSDDYYPALERSNVRLIASAVDRFTQAGVVDTDGNEIDADVVIFATGFNAVDSLSPMRIFGRDGRELADDWRDGPEAYIGVSVSGYPNLCLLMGPNTGLGHNSVIFMIEAQIRYSVRLIKVLLSGRYRSIDVKSGVQSRFNDRLQRSFTGSVWASGCKSWYQTDSGRQIALWPGFTFTYWFRTLRPRMARYVRHTDASG